MLESLMFAALGFLSAAVLAVLLAPPLWRRAVRLTTRRIEATMPMSVADIQADKDELRAEFAISLRKLELSLEKSKDQAARHLVERNRNQVMARQLQEELNTIKGELSARSSQTAVLQQNVSDRIPQLEAQNAAARSAIEAREKELNRLKETIAKQADTLTKAKQELEEQQRVEADRAKSMGREVDELQEENKQLVDQMSNLREHLTSADSSALDALQIEKQHIESELLSLKKAGAELDLAPSAPVAAEADAVATLKAENNRLSSELARLEEQLSDSARISEDDVSALKDEIRKLADQIMDGESDQAKKSKSAPATRSRRSGTPSKPTPTKTSQKKSTKAKPAARGASKSGKASSSGAKSGKQPRASLTQRLREMADSQAD